MSKVCGTSGDISAAMDEFKRCLTETELITLPMQGNTFTWHNCSTDSRSLWKRLDRMLVNDRWLEYGWEHSSTITWRPLWISFPWFIASVNEVVGISMYSVTRKLKALKPLLRQQPKKKVIAEFIAFYEQLLGGTRSSRTLDLTQYRPWASRILSHEDGVRLTRPVSTEDKSLGPDGYMAAFYKTVWPIVGGEITRAIMDFFTNGQLLNARLLATFDFQEGQLPVKDLGLPLISSRLSLANCRPLLDKIERRIQGCARILLSFAARVQLIKSVLMALNTYWAIAFILPKCIIKEIEKRLQNFLWKGVIGRVT
ncbi:hypothetical protein Sango_1934300 [Sesamum angolense]|uniref:Reverse transcriptase n=1 Tax=Sesamum angolense TaxID=2727404 RepID=A0AAE2BN93_9LAMI|nr:hypothetical protein Sango_1934300 [Sesamum angolense]